MKTLHHIYWWNLENLFDEDSSSERPAWLQSRLRSELKGWTKTVLDKKLTNLTNIICQLNGGNGPDILGVCEVENKAVLEKLMIKLHAQLPRTYKVMHQDTSDGRGIDVAIIYDTQKYSDDGRQFSLEIMKRNATRNLFQVQLTTSAGNELVLIGNHWPARSAGKYESEPYRMMVGETLSYWIERVHDIKMEERGEKHPAIILMGDFNDNPYDRSLTEYLRSSGTLEKVKNSTSHIMFNMMYSFVGGDIGTYVYGNDINVLDQFIVSRSLVVDYYKYPFQVESIQIVYYPNMVKGDYNTPIRFSRPSESSYNPSGYSDHLPIELVIEEN
ncbi:nuclease [Owenweeksia hongkongensis]|uniref:Putative extracellular nuclease n=1 Tax=Owenweeksia hongkongensis (strain DSM 17368 / CIP 108786 / JCM 12287 / NRRL B-23963 / UST20020801) TaxID=926562 RepID=G8QZS6_OWEHD|nr:nuclease [Owenweeksia hongkongensis]AEV31520.1 putative extracellular nuclease [Owenweeksia hongkongensis DSM 17368]